MNDLEKCTIDIGKKDKWVWKENDTNFYFVKSTYNKIRYVSVGEYDELFGELWRSRA